ncbi:lytic transglycosylase domain-containing protein [Pararhodobacter sp. SW119]|uniref:lytic transglycosylase domain-containing protein n=1 Tax=Pararhodobacter sp. SW119 TaxID=2780075 RepID=UPI001ADF88C0|nr:lytic transglycosylase domain-containing protein [Pararhodobacter sp. SW119]
MQPIRSLVIIAALAATGPATLTAREAPPLPRAAGAMGTLSTALAQGDGAAVNRLQPLAGPVGTQIALWQMLRAGGSDDPAAYDALLRALPHWPAMAVVQRQGEQRLRNASPQVVLGWFDGRAPLTAEGRLAQLRALEATGESDAARDLARAIWRDDVLGATEETALLARHAAALGDLHVTRLHNLLWSGARAAAERMLDRVPRDHAALARARLALQARAQGVNALIAAVPASLADDAGLAHDRFAWRMHHRIFDTAGDLMLERSRSAEGLGRPELWAAGRQRLVREALAEGQHQRAYDLAAHHRLEDGARAADLEWLAGFIALRHLDDPAGATRHFATLRGRVGSPISLSRAGYWEGLAQEAQGNDEAARAALAFAAEHQTAYYGQLAAERLGLPLEPALVDPPAYPPWRQTALAGSDLLTAAILLHRAGQWHEARRFVMHLAEGLSREEELGALADLWLARGEPNFAVNVAKIAVQSGVVLARANFPLTGLERADLPAPAELVLAIARRESEFDARVVSHADARGLLQVLPGTGELVARRLGIDFDPARLTTDPAFNALLGAAYLDGLIEEFGALTLVAAGYNAGPGRPRRWIQELGDPRDPAVDPVDWVEAIPFAETRNYVMRVMESLVIYRAVLSGDRRIRLTELLRGG